ncbi:MAG: diadenylate cyclase CdaA [Elusimicrobiota bacterium]|nr:diadenylate cyclase CdaA [Elusimicrobiota bacterium]
MSEILQMLQFIWADYIRHILDILISAFILYKLFNLIRGTRSVQVLKGIILLLVATVVADLLNFVLISWVLKWFWVAGAVALVIVFQPELRSFLAHLGSGKLTRIIMRGKVEFIEEVIKAVKEISRKGHGALIVFEQETGLRNYIKSGIGINAEVTAELLETIFTPRTPLHDGAVILSGDRIVAAGCILPLTHNPSMSKVIGTRHRAAVGLTELSDAIVCIVSEETGEYSLAHEGSLNKGMELDEIKKKLLNYYRERVAEKSINMGDKS